MIIKNENKDASNKIYKLSMEIASLNNEIKVLKNRIKNGDKSTDQRLFEANVKLVNDMDILKRELDMTTNERDNLVLLVADTIKELEKRKDNELNNIIKKLKNWRGDEEDA